MEAKQLSLDDFSKAYGIPLQTLYNKYLHLDNFPAYKQFGRWYVDIPQYLKFREVVHRNSYKYA